MERFRKGIVMIVMLLVLVSVPVSVYLLRSGTQTKTEAIFDLPISLIDELTGADDEEVVPVTEVAIDLVWPFIGKVGDAVAVYGQNFGNDPEQAMLFFGTASVSEDNIIYWSDSRVYFEIPETASGLLSAPITLMRVGSSASWETPFVVYDLSTQMQVMKPADAVLTKEIPADFQLEIFLDDGSILYGRPASKVTIPGGRTVLSVVVKDQSGEPVPFFVEPTEFGF